MPALLEKAEFTCAVEVFLATALLHKEQPTRVDFTISEIVARAAREGIHGDLRSGINVHASLHCVANRPPNPSRHRMLFATGKHTRRLFLPGDESHPERTGKIFPDAGEIPEKYMPVLEWAKKRFDEASTATGEKDDEMTQSGSGVSAATAGQWLGSLLELQGLGKEYWKDVDPDEFVRKLREGWE